MSLHPHENTNIPEETQRVAHAAFPKGNLYLRMRDELGEIYTDDTFADLFPGRGQPAEAPGRLAWVTVLQFSEGLSDRQAAEAVRARIDWKYVLGLEITDPGFDFSVLSEFRDRLIRGGEEAVLLDELLSKLKERNLIKAGGQQRTDSTHILAAVRQLNRLEILGETVRRALNELSAFDPVWVQRIAKPEWFSRYGRRFEQIRLPKEGEKRKALAETIGMDGFYLLETVRVSQRAEELRELAGVEFLRRMWIQQYWIENNAEEGQQLHLRENDNQPPGELRLHSPYDEDARFSAKRKLEWVGYKTHLSETCDPAEIHLITQVTTTLATEADMEALDTVHTNLVDKNLLPKEHLLDGGYVDGDALTSAKKDLGVILIGPIRELVSWQAKAGQGFDLANFNIDWENQSVTCPMGQTTMQWRERHTEGRKDAIQVRFSPTQCSVCPSRAQCTRAKSGTRTITFLPEEQHLTLQAARKDQNSIEFRKKYSRRAGVEGTISQGVGAYGLRVTRYIGLAKTHLQMLATAAAIDLHRLFDWWEQKPRAKTRVSVFARLDPHPVPAAPWWAEA
ncbi:MAG: IS1182 family transposase [Anaerolineales bacterium]